MIRYLVKKQKYKKPSESEAKEKFSIVLDPMPTMFEQEQCDRIINMSGFHPAEFKMAIAFYCELARKAMKEGRAIQLGDLGYLCPKISAATVEDDKEATAEKTLRKFSYYFKPSKELATMLKRQPFRKVVLPKGNKFEYTKDNQTTEGND